MALKIYKGVDIMGEITEKDLMLYDKHKKEMNSTKELVKAYEKQMIDKVNDQYSKEELERIAIVDLKNRKLNVIALLTAIFNLFFIFFTVVFIVALLQSYVNNKMALIPTIIGFAISGIGAIISGILLYRKSKFEKMLERIEKE